MACEFDPSIDLPWCRHAADALLQGNDVRAWAGMPFINRGRTVLPSSCDPEDFVSGELPWGAKGFILSMPPEEQLRARFRGDLSRTEEFTAFVTATVVHELVHFRQGERPSAARMAPPRRVVTATAPAVLLADYYADQREVEAHAAQIAYLLGKRLRPTRQEEVFAGTRVGLRIAGRLDSLCNGPQEHDYERWRRRLTHQVGRWRKRLFG